ncbi:hypothetical protein PMAYCL1PPCAC_25733, partial [Pristionchus mayeri]
GSKLTIVAQFEKEIHASSIVAGGTIKHAQRVAVALGYPELPGTDEVPSCSGKKTLFIMNIPPKMWNNENATKLFKESLSPLPVTDITKEAGAFRVTCESKEEAQAVCNSVHLAGGMLVV